MRYKIFVLIRKIFKARTNTLTTMENTDIKPKSVMFDINQEINLGYNCEDKNIIYIISVGCRLNNKEEELKNILNQVGELKENRYRINNVENFIEKASNKRLLKDISVGVLGEDNIGCLRAIERMGAKVKQINPDTETDEKFDITYSNAYIDSQKLSSDKKKAKELALRSYVLLSNKTKSRGISINSCGDFITTLHNMYFQLIGFEIKDYFRVSTEKDGFMLIMQKLNNRIVTEKEFIEIFNELKKRNPIRYV